MYLKSLFLRTLQTIVGLILFSFGVYLMIQANIGVAPWDALNLGLANHLPISYGDASVAVSITIVIVVLCLREPIGIGTVLDAVLVGKSVDLFTSWNLVPARNSVWEGILCMLAGIAIDCAAQKVYMSAGLGGGPRDMMLVGIGKRLRKWNIGTVQWIIYLVVLATGWLLGGPVGLGTLIATFGTGVIMRWVYRLLRFEPRHIRHESLLDVARHLGKKPIQTEL